MSVAQEILSLLPPQKTGGMPLMEALNKRQSSREYVDGRISDQQLSNLLWAACGVNRPDEAKRTAPSSRNKQEIDVYVAMDNGLFLYDHIKHALITILHEDIRPFTGQQDFVAIAGVNLIYVANYERAESDAEQYRATSSVNAGFIAQNVYLYCASEGLACVVRGWFERENLSNIMQLEGQQDIILTQTVGLKK